MSRRGSKAPPLAQNPIAASVERAIERGVSRMCFVFVDLDGQRYCVASGDMDVLAVSGLLALALGDLSAAGLLTGADGEQ